MTQLINVGETLLFRFGGGASTTRPVWGIFSPALGRSRVLLPLPHFVYNPAAGFRSVVQVIAKPIIGTSGHRRLGHGN